MAPTPAQNVLDQLIHLGITRWVVPATEIASPATMLFGFNAAQSAALAPTKEAPNLVPGSSARPADILLPYWCRGRPAALDVSVISPLQRLTLADAASTQGHALSVGVHRKLTSNLPACRAAGVDFLSRRWKAGALMLLPPFAPLVEHWVSD